MRLDYTNFQGFENVFLEDSFVTKIKTNAVSASFWLEIALTKNHPLYSSPKPNEHHCYKKGIIKFSELKDIVWVEINVSPSIDANNEIDFGNIDEFYLENDYYRLSGDWGELKIQSANPEIEYIEDK